MKNKKRTFAVIGLGTFGLQTAMELYRAGADVLAIDKDMKAVDVAKDYVTRAVCGDATDEEVLRAVGLFDVDTVIVAIRKQFDTTVIVTHLLKTAGLDDLFVQVDSTREASAIRALGARQAIFPESDLAKRFAQQLLHPTLTDFFALGEGMGLMESDVPRDWWGKTLIDLDIRRSHHVTIVAIERLTKRRGINQKQAVIPMPDEPFEKGDEIVILGNTERLARFREFIEEKLEADRAARSRDDLEKENS